MDTKNFSWKWWTKEPIWIVLLVSVVVRIIYLLFNYPLWWDSHVYIGMGKYIFSGGQIGIWEMFRPLLHPFILGGIWKMGIDPILGGKVLDLIYSLIIIYLTYILALRIYNKTVAWLAALIVSLTPLFVMFTGIILADPLAMIFGLWGLLVLVEKKGSSTKVALTNNRIHLFFSGFLLFLSFFSRFPQGIWFAVVFLVLLWRKSYLMEKIKQLTSIGAGFIIPLLAYLWFNYYLYADPFKPLTSGSFIVTTATWMYGTGITYYLTHFFLTTPIYLFFFYYLYGEIKSRNWDETKIVIILISLLTIIYFTYVPRKEPRYFATILPLLAIPISYSLIKIYHHLVHSKKPIVTPTFFIIFCVLLSLIPITFISNLERVPSFKEELRGTMEQYQIDGPILSSNPLPLSYVDNTVITLSGMEFAPQIYGQNKGKYALLLINDCDLSCDPQDQACSKVREDLFNSILAENKEITSKSYIIQRTGQRCTYTLYLSSK